MKGQGVCGFLRDGPLARIGQSNESLIGKDNLKDLILGWITALSSEELPATNTLKTGKITTAGILDCLEESKEWTGAAQVQILNGELEKVLNKKKEAYLQESDLIELLDGSDAFGSSTGKRRLCVRPNVWMFMGTQLQTYLREFGAASKGRLRLVLQALDSHQVYETPFEDKFVPRKCSNDLLIGVLRGILQAQQKPKEPANGGPAPGGRPATGQQQLQLGGVVPGTNWLSSSSRGAGRDAGGGRKKKRRQRSSEGHEETEDVQETRQPPTLVVPEVNKVSWDPAAGSIFAGLSDGAASAMRNYKKKLEESKGRDGDGESGPFNSTVTKHAGKAFGACCVGNLAIRNGLLRHAVPRAPLDSTIRSLDSLAGLAKTELYGINQMRVDRMLHKAEQREAKRFQTADEALEEADAEARSAPDWIATLDAAELAIRKLIDAIASDPEAWESATSETGGIPLRVPADSIWFNFRQINFSRKRARMLANYKQYGGIDNLNKFGEAKKWKEMLALVAHNGVAVNIDAEAEHAQAVAVFIRKTEPGRNFLSKIHASQRALELYAALPDAPPPTPQ